MCPICPFDDNVKLIHVTFSLHIVLLLSLSLSLSLSPLLVFFCLLSSPLVTLQFIVLTRWQNQELLDKWIADPDYVKAVAEMDEYTEGPINYKVMQPPKDELFLL